eukprot:CAMPEP_0184492320 /NCGR_PEP_ID=MMETSP0113_2-20130426/22859_1 /TAXON_ID=91329 /ORGANISM="Norrisiella sphaerica, Strain BC52" /LENGTH=799 /DNA_ID=CAMNT_0026877043 /DNA_START=52 /DNA_END=2451 /DNA_ORIENTATION=+
MARGHHGGYIQVQYEEKLLDKNEKTYYYRRWPMVVCVLLDSATVLVFNGLSTTFDVARDFKEYRPATSLVDVLLASWSRCLLILVLLLRPKYQKFVMWMAAVFLLLLVGKVILWQKWSEGYGSACLVSQLFVVFTELLLCKNFRVEVTENQEVADEENEAGASAPRTSTWHLMKVLGPYFWPTGLCNRIRALSTWLCVGASKLSNIMAPLFLGQAVNKLQDGHVDFKPIIFYALLGFTNVLFKQLQNIIYLGVKQTAYAQISENTFSHLHQLSLEWHLKKKMGNVLRSMDRGVNSANTVVSYLFLYLVPCVVECVVVFAIFYTKYNEPALSVIAFFGISGYAISTVTITLWRKKFRKATNRHDNELHDKATDSLMNFETVKYFTNEQFEIQDYSSSVKQYIKYDVSTQASLGMLNTIQQLFISGTLGCVLCVSAYRVSRGDMNVGDFVAINAYIVQLFAPLSFLGTIYNAIIQAFVDMQNLSDLLALEPDVVDAPGAKALVADKRGCEIEFKSVVFHYPSMPSNTGLKGVSFTVKRGTTTAIVGHTGAGKSTIGRLLFRFYDLKSGMILIDGQDISQVKQHSLRKTIGVVPQDTVMFNRDIYHNIQYGNLAKSKEDVTRACEAAQILDFIERLPESWDTKVGERGLKLSGGEKQRVAIARCLLKDPPVVLLDEATSSLDSVTEQAVQKAILKLGKNRTCIVIAHRLSTIAHAEQIIVLDRGQICESGTHKQLMEQGGVYSRMWHAQGQRMDMKQPAKKELLENEETVGQPQVEEKRVGGTRRRNGHHHGHGHGHHNGHG